jgi:hypothetical protein
MIRSIVFALSIVLFSCNSAEKKFDTDTYEKNKESLEAKEKKHPEQFLVVTGHDRKNIIGQRVIKGTINNKASVCTYKDVQLKISFYSKTGVLLEENKETIFEIVPPNNQVNFKTKYFAPKDTDSVAMVVISAKAETK